VSYPACARSRIYAASWKFKAQAAEDATREGHLADVEDRGDAADPGDLGGDRPIPAAITLASSATRRRWPTVYESRSSTAVAMANTSPELARGLWPGGRPHRDPADGVRFSTGTFHPAAPMIRPGSAISPLTTSQAPQSRRRFHRLPAGHLGRGQRRSPDRGPPRLDGANLFTAAKSPAPSQ
jgi:hypothetical protein